MTFHIVTIFPEIFDSYFGESILGRAKKNKIVDVKIYNLRDFTKKSVNGLKKTLTVISRHTCAGSFRGCRGIYTIASKSDFVAIWSLALDGYKFVIKPV